MAGKPWLGRARSEGPAESQVGGALEPHSLSHRDLLVTLLVLVIQTLPEHREGGRGRGLLATVHPSLGQH